jgi:hypothetical protein
MFLSRTYAKVGPAAGSAGAQGGAYAGIFFESTGAAASYVLRGEITSDLSASDPHRAGDGFVGASDRKAARFARSSRCLAVRTNAEAPEQEGHADCYDTVQQEREIGPMNTAARVFNLLIRICGAGALVLGLAFWFGYARSFTHLHIAFGIGLVISLWVLAGIAWRRTARTGLVLFAAVWGFVTWIFGTTHGQILPGSFHWVIEVAHLAMGAVAIAAGGLLAGAVARRRNTQPA